VKCLVAAGIAAERLLAHPVVDLGNVSLEGGAVACLVGAARALEQLHSVMHSLRGRFRGNLSCVKKGGGYLPMPYGGNMEKKVRGKRQEKTEERGITSEKL
jgi:hypothetical protein